MSTDPQEENENEKEEKDEKEEKKEEIITEGNYKVQVLPDDYAKYDISFKLIVIGDSGVGKSCLSNKATKNVFEPTYNATIGFEFFSFNIKLDDQVIKLQVWDTCGQELYRSLITNFYRNSSLAIIVYAINDKDSFQNIENWLKELKSYSNPDVKVFLIGNKIDLEDEREITYEQGEKLSKDYDFNLFMESSAKTGINARSIFIKAAAILYDDYKKYDRVNSMSSEGSFRNSVEQMVVSEKRFGRRKKKGNNCSC